MTRVLTQSPTIVGAFAAMSLAVSVSAALGQTNGGVVLALGIDGARNADFVRKDEDFPSFVYKMTMDNGRNKIELATSEIMSTWKGSNLLSDIPFSGGASIDSAEQFAPVFLIASIINDDAEALSISESFLEVTESQTDLQPYLEIGSWDRLQCHNGSYKPEFNFRNLGWSPAIEPEMVHVFKSGKASSKEFSARQINFDTQGQGSLDSSFVAAGVKVAQLRKGRFKCASTSAVPGCFTRLKSSGILGSLATYSFTDDNKVYTDAEGQLRYSWKDVKGVVHNRVSPFKLTMPILFFDTGDGPECGAPGPVDRDDKPLKLSLDRQNYRIPLKWRDTLPVRAEKRFSIALAADKASTHSFSLVVRLSNGVVRRTPMADLSYFVPRIPAENSKQ